MSGGCRGPAWGASGASLGGPGLPGRSWGVLGRPLSSSGSDHYVVAWETNLLLVKRKVDLCWVDVVRARMNRMQCCF